MKNSFNICQEFVVKGAYYDKVAKLMQVDINHETRRFILRFDMSMKGEPCGQWVVNEDAFRAMMDAGDMYAITDIPVVDLTGEHFDKDLFEV